MRGGNFHPLYAQCRDDTLIITDKLYEALEQLTQDDKTKKDTRVEVTKPNPNMNQTLNLNPNFQGWKIKRHGKIYR